MVIWNIHTGLASVVLKWSGTKGGKGRSHKVLICDVGTQT